MKIRPATKSDVDEWLALRETLWPGHQDEHRNAITEYFRGSSIHLEQAFLAENEHRKIIGFIELNIRNYAEGSSHTKVPYIEGWFVNLNYRGKGVGRKLIKAAELWALDQGYSELASGSNINNKNAINAHKALGFIEMERNVNFLKNLGVFRQSISK